MDAILSSLDKAEALAAEFASHAARHDQDGSVPFENFKRLRDAGLLALTVPRDVGGAGAGLLEAARVIGLIAGGEPSTALILAMQYLHHRTIAERARWPADIAARLQRDAVEQGALINALRVEPELGTPARGGLPATTARRVADGWEISGHKIYCTGAPALSWYVVWARTDEPEPRVGQFLVPSGQSGIRIASTWNHLGLRASGSHDVVFSRVAIPAEYAVDIRPPNAWVPEASQAAGNILVVSALYDGIARAARDWLTGFLRTRTPSNLGASLATVPRIQEAVGAIEALLAVNRRLIESLGQDVDRGQPPSPAEAGLVKLTVTNNAIQAVEAALALTGNHGLSRANPLERHYRDVLCARVHTPQDDSIRVAAGRHALGI